MTRKAFHGIIAMPELESVEKLISGGQSDVYLVEIEGKEYILKKYKGNFDPKILREITAFHLHSGDATEYIVPLHGIYYFKSQLSLVFEHMRGGDLFDYIGERQRRRAPFTPSEVRVFAHRMLTAIRIFHDYQLIHRDIKPENILLERPDDLSSVRIADFGLCTLLSHNTRLTPSVGTAQFRPPEMLTVNYDAKVDIYSIGIIILTMLNNVYVVNENLQQQLARLGDGPDAQMVRAALDINPRKRFTAAQLLEMDYFKDEEAQARSKSI
ncbi:CAMK/CAMKL protein kinase [Fonticula alba]|uniref:CAMK/CAMKL protein kinase n=1 Tax=Fonticula alba TaxID=691883 RepID=A0A058ZDS2_FONAL|nr:CAMK/CAMKL protein kinase [Fonticula alba]KCV72106.1 CAMK/CAMKL protein kinase [Fonticula alba]|eukprot:XP_009493684.1 CAMK/CAMKL protein kinase [Fonticula alba]